MKINIIVGSLVLVLGAVSCTKKSITPEKVIAEYADTGTITEIPKPLNEPSELTLGDALSLTLEKNPDLKSYSYDVRATEARSIQSKLIPNPEISISIEDVMGSGDYRRSSQSQNTLQLSQLIELGGKRGARGDVADAMTDLSKNDYEIKRVEILTSLTDKFIRTAADEHLFNLAKKTESIADKALQSIKKRAEAGKVSDLEESKSRVLRARAIIIKEHAEHELLTAKKELAAFWGVDIPQFLKLKADLFKNTELPKYEDLEKLVDESPEVKRWASEKRLREAEQRLARAKSVPNLLLSGGPRKIETTNSDTWVFQVTMPLAIFDRNQGGRQEADLLSEKTSVTEEATKLRLKTAIFGLYQEMAHAQTELAMMKTEIIPLAEKALKVAEEGYINGRFSHLDYLDSQKTLIEVNRENIEAAYLFHSYRNAIERLLGIPVQNQLLN